MGGGRGFLLELLVMVGDISFRALYVLANQKKFLLVFPKGRGFLKGGATLAKKLCSNGVNYPNRVSYLALAVIERKAKFEVGDAVWI